MNLSYEDQGRPRPCLQIEQKDKPVPVSSGGADADPPIRNFFRMPLIRRLFKRRIGVSLSILPK